MSPEADLLGSTVIFLFAAVVAVLVAKYMRLGAVLGYLVAGAIIGPQVLGLIGNPDSVAKFAELGVVLLLFVIGLELSPRQLWTMRKALFGAGLAQVLISATVIGFLGSIAFGLPLASSAVIGLGLSLSSTAFGIQSLVESRQLQSPHGRVAFAVLLFQDIASIPAIALIPLIASQHAQLDTHESVIHAAKAIASISLVVICGRFILRPLFRAVASTGLPEVSTATALLVVVGTAWLMNKVGLSMALGTFIAGLLLSDSEYRHELSSQIEPFKGLLLALFFIGVGMSANLALLQSSALLVIGLTLILIIIKLPILFAVGRLVGGLNSIGAVQLSSILAAGGEFAFVVLHQAKTQGLISSDTNDILLLTITLSMCVTPFLVMICNGWARRYKAPVKQPDPGDYANIEGNAPEVVIAGMGRVGQIVARILRAQNVPFIALDTSVETIDLIRSFERVPVFYGDPLRPEILNAAKVSAAKYFLIANDDQDESVQLAELVRRLHPNVKVIARARNRQHAHRLANAGADAVRETFYSSLEMSRTILVGMGLNKNHAERQIRKFAEHDERVLAIQRIIAEDQSKVLQSTHAARAELAKLFQTDVEDDQLAPSRET
ncbi:monovalent cation:proton antiporter-2 (CPA2) family protein [Pseudomonas sp. ME-P-057]|uniref:monovalent cation:proton antiporter-2 (CPA2) family protein n=1 Tax=Pseudomonas sp. ME-P-057 TaxID=3040321 RepID=UPI002555E293|nr:monovalent cation:proton antiporter-2 (CPA2) family protein [Pseudomonas sp. ME-P-057]